MINVPHVPVMSNEVCKHLLIKKDGVYLDGTVGFGGHSQKVLDYINKDGILIGLDLDPYALEYSNKHLSVHLNSFSLYHANYMKFPEIIDSLGIKKLNGMLFDLGTSSYQVDSRHRGFSYMKDCDLNMRFDYGDGMTAEDFLNSTDQESLANIIYKYSGEKKSRRIAKYIVKNAFDGKMKTTYDLRNSIEGAIGKKYLIKSLSRVFQSIRIHVNHELESLTKLLSIAFDYLEIGGRIIFITFHSIEDRMVKASFQNNATLCICPKEIPICQCNINPKIKILTRKAIVPSNIELNENPRARSAQMRVAEGI